MNVRFFAGTKADYLNLPAPKNPLGLYFCADTQELFWADRLLTDGVRVVSTQQDLPELQSAAEGIVYYVTETRNGYVLAPDRSKWLQTIYAPVTDASKVPEDEIYSTVTTVGAVRDIENKIYNTVNSLDARVADIELSISDTGIKAISFAGYDFAKTADGVFTIDRANARRALGFIVPEGQELDEVEFATKTFVENRLESIQSINPDEYAKLADLEKFVTKPEIDTLIANKADKEHTHTEYLTAIPSEYITEAELDNKGYLTQHQSLDGFATEAWVESKNYLTAEQSLSTYATKEELANAIDSIDHPTVDLTEYVTKTELDGFIKEIPAEYVTEGELEAKGYLTEHQDLSEYAKTTDLPAVPTKVSELTNDKNYITSIPDEYITEAKLNAKNYLTEHQSLAGLATEQFVNDAINNIDIPEVPSNISAFVNDAGYITKVDIPKVDFSGLATLEQLATKVDNIPFIEDKFVTSPMGNFTKGDSVKGMSVAEILAKLLGLSDNTPIDPELPSEPESVVDNILANELSMYSVNDSGELIEVPYNYIVMTEAEAAAKPTESGFYQIKDTDGNVIESGYQDLQIKNGDLYYIFALPKAVDYSSMVSYQSYDTEDEKWLAGELDNLVSDPATVEELCTEVGIDISHIDTNVYTVYAQEAECTGKQIRFIIKEAS